VNAIIRIDDLVRSHDFEDWERPGRPPCYIEGKVEGFVEMHGCQRYSIRVTREVWNGEEVPRTAPFSKHGLLVHPPLNGTPTSMGSVTNFVRKIQ
jgi:hypothetical protein